MKTVTKMAIITILTIATPAKAVQNLPDFDLTGADFLLERVTLTMDGLTRDAVFDDSDAEFIVVGKAVYRDGFFRTTGFTCSNNFTSIGSCHPLEENLQVLEIAPSGLSARVIDHTEPNNERIDTVQITPSGKGFYLHMAKTVSRIVVIYKYTDAAKAGR